MEDREGGGAGRGRGQWRGEGAEGAGADLLSSKPHTDLYGAYSTWGVGLPGEVQPLAQGHRMVEGEFRAVSKQCPAPGKVSLTLL